MQYLDICLQSVKPAAVRPTRDACALVSQNVRIVLKWVFRALASVGVALVAPIVLSTVASASIIGIQILLGLGRLWFANFHSLSL